MGKPVADESFGKGIPERVRKEGPERLPLAKSQQSDKSIQRTVARSRLGDLGNFGDWEADNVESRRNERPLAVSTMIPPDCPPLDPDPFGFAALQKDFNAFLTELEQVGSLIACRPAEEKADSSSEVSPS
jgi:hypothetical protein